ncbi:MAG: HRDC domain-containing protein [Deltaproteobacteria bacterium]|nr:HRDC domain-containing protein [Deltaproteobacteria bacterium]
MTRQSPHAERDADYCWVDSQSVLSELAEALAADPLHALDTESNSGFAYRERLCLLQFNVGGSLWMVDLLALPGDRGALAGLRMPLEAAGTRTLLHGGEFDVGCLKRDYDIALGGVWDTQQAASYLGWPRTGYGAVVEEICGVSLDKAFAHYDWGRRPVSPAPLSYAVDDVRYLPRIAEHLEREIDRADLAEELSIANQVVMGAAWSGRNGIEAIWRAKGVHKLPAESLPRLVALWEWREGVASIEDRPPGRVLNTQLLMALARRAPRRESELRSIGLRGRTLRYAGDLLGVLRRADERPPRVPEAPRGERSTPGEAQCLKRLREWRRLEAERRGVPQHVVLPPTAMQHLARHGADQLESVPQLGEKRSRLYASRFLELCT